MNNDTCNGFQSRKQENCCAIYKAVTMKHIRKIQIFHAITLLSSHVLRFFHSLVERKWFPIYYISTKIFFKKINPIFWHCWFSRNRSLRSIKSCEQSVGFNSTTASGIRKKNCNYFAVIFIATRHTSEIIALDVAINSGHVSLFAKFVDWVSLPRRLDAFTKSKLQLCECHFFLVYSFEFEF